MKLGVTGHRPQKLSGGFSSHPIHDWVQSKLRSHMQTFLEAYGDLILITGMAQGVDLWAAEIALDLHIPFIAAVPCDRQESRWPSYAQEYYRRILAQSVQIEIVCPGPYESWKMQARNEWIVDHSDHMLAVWNGSPGGTGNCVGYAMKRVGNSITFIDPRNYTAPI